MMYVQFPLLLRNVEDLLHERGVDVSRETVQFWWNRFGPMFASEITRRRRNQARSHFNWQWHFDEVFVKINGERVFVDLSLLQSLHLLLCFDWSVFFYLPPKATPLWIY